MCCSVMQCFAVCCSVVQCGAVCVAVCCSVLQCVAVCCSVLQCVAVCCSVLQCVAVCCSVLPCVAVFCRHTATTHCNNSLQQHTATAHCNNLCNNTLQQYMATPHTATTLQHALSVLQCVAACCSVLQCQWHTCLAANSPPTHTSALQQHTSKHCNTLQRTDMLPDANTLPTHISTPSFTSSISPESTVTSPPLPSFWGGRGAGILCPNIISYTDGGPRLPSPSASACASASASASPSPLAAPPTSIPDRAPATSSVVS